MRILRSTTVLVMIFILTVMLATSIDMTSGRFAKLTPEESDFGLSLIKPTVSSALSGNSNTARNGFSTSLPAMLALVSFNLRSLFAFNQQILSYHLFFNAVWFPWLSFGNVAIPARAAPLPVNI